MAQIVYEILTGIPNFTASLSPSVAPPQTLNSLGIYSFDNIPEDNYTLTVVDINGCISVNYISLIPPTTSTTTIYPCILQGTIDCNYTPDCILEGNIECDYTTTTTTSSSTSTTTSTSTTEYITTTTTTSIVLNDCIVGGMDDATLDTYTINEWTYGQIFTLPTCIFQQLDFHISLYGSPNFDIRLNVYTLSGGLPDAYVGQSLNIIHTDSSMNKSWYFNLSLSAGYYAIVINYENIVTHDGSNFVGIEFNYSNVYPGGYALESSDNGVSWTILSGWNIDECIYYTAFGDLPTTTTTSTSTSSSTTTTTTTIPEALELTFDNISNTPVVDPTDVSQWNIGFNLPASGTPFNSVVVVGNTVKLYGGSNIQLNNLLNNIPFYPTSSHLISVYDNSGCIISLDYSFTEDDTLLSVSLPAVTIETNSSFMICTGLTYLNIPLLTSASIACFSGLSSLLSLDLPLLVTAGQNCFECPLITNLSLPSLTSIGDGGFDGMSAITSLSIPLCTSLGSTTGDNNVFQYLTGQTITLTIPTALMTCNTGNPDGDIQTLQANNTVTIITV